MAKQTLRDLMTPNPITLDATATAAEAARLMKDRHVGDVLVCREGKLCGIVTDRDIVVRGLAEDPVGVGATKLGELCTREIASLGPETQVADAIRLMEERAIRRVPVVQDGAPVGIVSLGDLAVARDRNSVLGRISAAPPTPTQ
jgi:CBS domain-containing protein